MEQDKIHKELDEKTEALKNAEEGKKKVEEELNKAKGVVKQTPNPNAIKKGQEKDPKFYEANIKEITKEHDHDIELRNSGKKPLVDNRLKGFSEMINLQAQADDLTADLSERDKSYIRYENPRILDKNDADMVIKR